MTDRIHRFIVPLKGVNTFCTFRDGEIVPANALPLVGHDGHAIDEEFGWVAWIADDGKTIGRTHLDAVEGEGGFAPLRMPEGYTAGCLLFHRQVLFVGGECGEEVIGSFDFARPEPKWMPLEVPKQFQKHGKRIDDLLLDGVHLIAVDNIVFPKYLLRYDISSPRAPRLIGVSDLGPHGVYEHIACGAVGNTWLALLSTSFGMGGGYAFLSLLNRHDFGEHGWLQAPRNDDFTRRYSGTDPATARTWHHIIFHGDILLIAADKDGVGVLDLRSIPRPEHALVGDEFRYSGRLDGPHRRFVEECQASLKYIRPATIGGPVVSVHSIPDSSHCLLVVETESGLDTVGMELPS